MRTSALTVDVRLQPADVVGFLRQDALTGLSARPRQLLRRRFSDRRGAELFAEVTRLADYYPARRECEIFELAAPEIAELCSAETLVLLGSVTSRTSRALLQALDATGRLRRLVVLDVDPESLIAGCEATCEEFPRLEVHAVVGDVDRHLDAVPGGGRRLVAFVGGAIGNLGPVARLRCFNRLRSALHPGDTLVMGADLVTDAERLIRTYNDAAGVTAAFNRNVLEVLNRELGATFAPDRFEHVVRWDADNEWIEMFLRSTDGQIVDVPAVDLRLWFNAGEMIRTEVSARFRRERLARELDATGWAMNGWWADPLGEYAAALAFAG